MFLSICGKGKLCNCKKDSFKRKIFKIKIQMFKSTVRNNKIKLVFLQKTEFLKPFKFKLFLRVLHFHGEELVTLIYVAM